MSSPFVGPGWTFCSGPSPVGRFDSCRPGTFASGARLGAAFDGPYVLGPEADGGAMPCGPAGKPIAPDGGGACCAGALTPQQPDCCWIGCCGYAWTGCCA